MTPDEKWERILESPAAQYWPPEVRPSLANVGSLGLTTDEADALRRVLRRRLGLST